MDRAPTEPFYEPFPQERGPPAKGPDPIHVLAYRGAVTGADAYRAVRSAVRLEDRLLRLGNRFVSVDSFREIAFIAAGNAAISSAFALSNALGDRLTQGFVAAPDVLPQEIPFRSERLSPGWPGQPGGESISAAALELAAGLGEKDLLFVVVSPGALGALATAAEGFSRDAWGTWLKGLSARGATGGEVALLARLLGHGAVGGRLAEAAGVATVVTLVIERGDGPLGVGGGPTRRPTPEERTKGRAVLERLGEWASLSSGLQRSFSPDATRLLGLPGSVHRPVLVAGPADALRGAADAVGEKKYMPRLAALSIREPPELAADRFLERTEAVIAENLEELRNTELKGIVCFAALTLGLPEGVDDGPEFERFLAEVQHKMRRREMSVGLLRTSGAPGPKGLPPGAVVGAPAPGASSASAGLRPLPMRSGITDVGLIAVALASGRGDGSLR